jgi:hypothetical protein
VIRIALDNKVMSASKKAGRQAEDAIAGEAGRRFVAQ